SRPRWLPTPLAPEAAPYAMILVPSRILNIPAWAPRQSLLRRLLERLICNTALDGNKPSSSSHPRLTPSAAVKVSLRLTDVGVRNWFVQVISGKVFVKQRSVQTRTLVHRTVPPFVSHTSFQ